ncbi:MAG TPA: transmembrane domain-containing protein, partial [Candidatus Paceibacterota bacterium]|nr:transmembrane domain-containing protein [Candidatus Paceibacterota bacterium]
KATLQSQTASQKPSPVPAAPAKEESIVKSLKTYRGAIEEAIQHKNVSVVSIAAAEAERRGAAGHSAAQASAPEGEEVSHELGLRIAAIVGGIALLVGALGLIVFVFLRPAVTSPVQNNFPSPFISVDATQIVAIPVLQWKRGTLMTELEKARESTSLSLGLMSRLYVVEASSTEQYSVDAPTFLGTLAPDTPPELLRSLGGEYLLGIHVFDANQTFLILDIENYTTAYSAMLGWEWTMQADLEPLFTRKPRPRIPEEGFVPPPAPAIVATSSATSTAGSATSSTTVNQPPPQFIQPRFIDRVVENRDTRVIQNQAGDILLLWTFLDRSTLLITTNEYTLREVVSRLNRPPVIPLP